MATLASLLRSGVPQHLHHPNPNQPNPTNNSGVAGGGSTLAFIGGGGGGPHALAAERTLAGLTTGAAWPTNTTNTNPTSSTLGATSGGGSGFPSPPAAFTAAFYKPGQLPTRSSPSSSSLNHLQTLVHHPSAEQTLMTTANDSGGAAAAVMLLSSPNAAARNPQICINESSAQMSQTTVTGLRLLPTSSNDSHIQSGLMVQTATTTPAPMDSTETSAHQHQSTAIGLLAPPVSPGLCAICHDRATGKHYGANSCDGCKGFFRRTIRKAQKYSCRFEKQCCIDKDKRNSCRYCRFQKCLHAGMKKDAVQNERDRIQNRRASHNSNNGNNTNNGNGGGVTSRRQSNSLSSPHQIKHDSNSNHQLIQQEIKTESVTSSPVNNNIGGSPTTINDGVMNLHDETPQPNYQEYIDILQRAEAYYTESQLRTTVITRTADQTPLQADRPKVANLNDIGEAMHQQLLLMVEWAKTLSPFYELSMDDQVVLLRNYAAQHLLICVAYRSRNVKDYLLLTNSTCLPRTIDSCEISDVNHVTTRALDELVRPMRDLNIDEIEFVCLRAIVFFNPMARGLEDTVGRVLDTRQAIIGALQHHVNRKSPKDQFRFGNLLLLLPPLQAISQNLREDLQLATMFGMAQIDSLLHELLLSDTDKTSAIMEMSSQQGSVVGSSNECLFPNMTGVLTPTNHSHSNLLTSQAGGAESGDIVTLESGNNNNNINNGTNATTAHDNNNNPSSRDDDIVKKENS